MIIHKLYAHIIIYPIEKAPVLPVKLPAFYHAFAQSLETIMCDPIAINGTEDHVHICCKFHPLVSADNIMDTLLNNSADWLREFGNVPDFPGWDEGWGFFGVHHTSTDMLKKYIADQKIFHKTTSFETEWKQLLQENGF